MDLNEFLGPDPVVVDLKAANRWEAIDELMDHLVVKRKIQAEHRIAIAESIKRREKSMSTGIGFGVGIPHASSGLVAGLVAAVGRSRTGVEFDALDGKLVKLVILFIVPQGEFQKHSQILADIAKSVHRRDFGDGLGL